MHEMRHESVLDKGKAQTNENHAPKNLMVDTLRKKLQRQFVIPYQNIYFKFSNR